MTEETKNNSTSSKTHKHEKTIADYVGDMVALESHIEEALDRQLELLKDHGKAHAAVQRYHDMVKKQRDDMKALLEELPENTAGNPIIEKGSTLLGKVAGLIDKIRTEGNSKALRDDYTAFNLAAVSYAMLYTTAKALGNAKVAEMSERHLKGYAKAVQEINDLIPEVVVNELEKDGHEVQPGAAADAEKMIDRVWKQTATN
jgi:ferritin-like metal-binding protein YciE